MSEKEKFDAKKIFSLSNLGLAVRLCVIVTAVVLLLAVVNYFTAPVIAKNEAEKGDNARLTLVPDADSFALFEGEIPDESGNISEVYLAKKGDETVAYCLNTTASGFGGEFELVIGVTSEMKVCGVKVISHSETAGIGAAALDEQNSLMPQFSDLSADAVDKVVTVSGATVTSKAVKKAVNEACAVAAALKEGGAK